MDIVNAAVRDNELVTMWSGTSCIACRLHSIKLKTATNFSPSRWLQNVIGHYDKLHFMFDSILTLFNKMQFRGDLVRSATPAHMDAA